MGSVFVVAICPVPRYADGRPTSVNAPARVITTLEKRVDALPSEKLKETFEICDGASFEEHCDTFGLETEEEQAEALNDRRDEVRAAITELLTGYRRDMTTAVIEGREYMISGGPTWSDDPTEAYAWIQLLDASDITEEPLFQLLLDD